MFRKRLDRPDASNPSQNSAADVAVLQARIEMLEAAVELAPIAIVVYDADDVLRVHNQAYQRIYDDIWESLPRPITYAGLVRASLLKRGFSEGLEAEVARRVALQRNGDGKIEERQYSDGIWRRVTKVRAGNGSVAGYALDINELRAREEQLRSSKDELSRVAGTTVPEAVIGFAQVADEVISANDEVKQLVAESAERAVATGAAAEELAVTINHVAATIKETADSAAASSREAATMAERMERLGEALAKVNAFADMIRGIAAQTNLLALNATIEAARAGDAGRGFSVVAAEVKALSKQTGDATAEIAAQVAAVEALMADA
ncbi:MAG: methyl-accepting chemotaxis protein, partial [Beijerinckiaceae bacterium]